MPLSKPAYADRIVQDPEIMVGKPTVRGTRITVEAVLNHLAANPDLDDLFVHIHASRSRIALTTCDGGGTRR